MIEVAAWLVLLVLWLMVAATIVRTMLRNARAERKKKLAASIRSLETELDLHEGGKTKQPPPPKPQEIEIVR